MSVEIIECEQGTREWYAARIAIPTASAFHKILANGRGGNESKTRSDYLYQLAAEQLTGLVEEGYSNPHMERGKLQEGDGRSAYSAVTDNDVRQVGFIRNGRKGASPDGLVGNNGMIEVKSRMGKLQVKLLIADQVPPEHIAQLQGNLWVAEREWIDFCAFCPGLRPYVRRVYRDERYIATLGVAVDEFLGDMDELLLRIAA